MKKFIKAQEIPYDELQKTMGMSENDFLNLPPRVLDKVLSGRLSPLMHLKVDTGNYVAEGVMKFGLTREPDGSVGLKFYPMEKKLKYDQEIKSEERQRLNKGEAVLKDITRGGITEKMYIQLDRETNNIIEMKSMGLNIPDTIADVELGLTQQQRIREGRPLQIDKDGTSVTIGVDLEDLTNFRVLNGNVDEWREQKLQVWERLNRGVATAWNCNDEGTWQLKQFNLDREFGQNLEMESGHSMSMGIGRSLGLGR